MPVYRIDIGDHTYRVESDSELSDQQAYDAARSSPAAIQDQNEVMRSNMAKQATAGEAPSQWTPAAMGQRALEGLKGEAEGLGVGLIGAATLPFAVAHGAYQAARHPLETAQSAIKGMYLLGNMADSAISHPRETLNTVTDVATKVGSNPRMIGRIAGSIDAGILAQGARSALGRAIPATEAATEAAPAQAVTKFYKGRQWPFDRETPIELTRRLNAEHRAAAGGIEAARASAYPAAESIAVKPSFSAQEVVRIKLLMQQGLSQADAVQLVKNSVLGQFLGQ